MTFEEFKRKYRHHYLRAQAEVNEKVYEAMSPEWLKKHFAPTYWQIVREIRGF